MKFQSTRFGTYEVKDNTLLTFPSGREQIAQSIEHIGACSGKDTASRYDDLHGLVFAHGDRLGFGVPLIGHRVPGRDCKRRDIGFGSGKDGLPCNFRVSKLHQLTLDLTDFLGDRAASFS